MSLVNDNTMDILKSLEGKLLECIDQDQFVNIHVQSDSINFHHCIIPDEINVETNSIYINAGLFTLEIRNDTCQKAFNNANCYKTEDEQSFMIKSNNTYIYFDFCLK